MDKLKRFTFQNEKDTADFASEFARRLKKGDIVCLYGELGAGKTSFTSGIVKALGFDDRVMSPTFTIVRTYSKSKNVPFVVHHIDLYRLENPDLVEEVGIEELLNDSSISFIEWPERLGRFLPKKRYDIFFDVIGESKRMIGVQKYE